MSNLLELIKERKSVRTYDARPLSAEHQSELEAYAKAIRNPFEIPVEFVMLDAKEHGLSSPVLAGETEYVAAKVKKQPNAEVAYGYSFEKLILHAKSLGIGTVFIGGTMKRELFEMAANVQTDELMPCVSPLGYPAAKRSLKEVMMRKGVKADTRLNANQLFFKDSWGNPLETAELSDVFEMVRMAPSAVNKQPWRIVEIDGVYHFYEKKDKGYDKEATGDLQKIDIGIALCHFMMGLEELGKQPEVSFVNPGIEVPQDVEYVLSVSVS